MKGEGAIVRGAIDGCLSVLGVVIGAYGIDSSLLLSAALAGNLANGMSNVLAAFSASSAQRSAHLRALERAMLTDLQGTEPDQAARSGAVWEAASDGLATMAGGSVPVIPFFMFPAAIAIGWSITLSLLVMFVLGAWAGRFSRQGMLLSAVKLVTLAILTVLACLLIRHLVVPGGPVA